MAKEVRNMPRLQEVYVQTIRPQLMTSLNLENVMEIPKISKIVLNIGSKDSINDSKALNTAVEGLAKISGQKPVKTLARKSIAGFKLREGMAIGAMVTLRSKVMYEFLDRLISTALPQIRDFQGVTRRLDGRGGYNIGIKDWMIFPEIDYGMFDRSYGLNISIHTTAKNDEHGFALLKAFGMPFAKSDKQ